MIKTIQSNRVLTIMTATFMTILLITSLLTFIPTKRASAAPAAIPVLVAGGAAVIALFTSMGIITKNANDTYKFNNSDPYIGNLMNRKGLEMFNTTTFTEGQVIQIADEVLPSDVYYSQYNSDMERWDTYIGKDLNELVSSKAQLVVKSSALPTDFSMPVNFTRIVRGVRYGSATSSLQAPDMTSFVKRWNSQWFTPYYERDGVLYLGDHSFQIGIEAGQRRMVSYRVAGSPDYDFSSTYKGFSPTVGKQIYIEPMNGAGGGFPNIGTSYTSGNNFISNITTWQHTDAADTALDAGNYWNVSTNSTSSAYRDLQQGDRNGLFVSSDIPTFDLEVDKEKLGDVIISVGGSPQPPANLDPEDPDEDDTYIDYVPPSLWEVFKTVADFLEKTGTLNTNNGTTLDQYVNNNYNYNTVDVDVNLPERFQFYFENPLDVNLNLSGGVNVDITINDKTELPSISEGDGSNFFSANVIDVFAGLTVNNPVMAVIKELFGVIDPALVAIFSVTISLMLVLALWKLIRG